MADELPEPSIIRSAVDIYLRHAYGEAPLPKSVLALLENVRAFQSDPSTANHPFAKSPDGKSRYTLRLGNRFYLHMKLMLEPTPDGSGEWLFKPDTHDRHLCPAPTSPDYNAFIELRAKNQTIAEAIDQAWEQAGIPTFKTFLRRDLARRKALRRGGEA